MKQKTRMLHTMICGYKSMETLFERMANAALRLFGNSIVFMLALVLVVVWFCVHDWHQTSVAEGMYHVIIAITFLSFFIIQRTFTHFTLALHLKLNELVTSNEHAHNSVINAELLSGAEIKEMAKVHDQIIADEAQPKEDAE